MLKTTAIDSQALAEPIAAIESTGTYDHAAQALGLVRDGIITGEGPTTKGRRHSWRDLDAADASAGRPNAREPTAEQYADGIDRDAARCSGAAARAVDAGDHRFRDVTTAWRLPPPSTPLSARESPRCRSSAVTRSAGNSRRD